MALVLTRRAGERISIGDGIVVTLVRIRGSQVQLAIEAPDEVHIDRLPKLPDFDKFTAIRRHTSVGSK